MGVIAAKRGQLRCGMTIQVVSTPIAWSHSCKFTLDRNKSNNYNFKKIEEILNLFLCSNISACTFFRKLSASLNISACTLMRRDTVLVICRGPYLFF